MIMQQHDSGIGSRLDLFHGPVEDLTHADGSVEDDFGVLCELPREVGFDNIPDRVSNANQTADEDDCSAQT
jgi:hypothetical protein